MPPKKKPKATGYYLFMEELQQQYRKKGLNYNMDRMKDIASPEWNQLSLAEKAEYNKRAKVHNKDVLKVNDKLASDGTSIRENQLTIEQAQQEDNQMKYDIQEYIQVRHQTDIDMFKCFASSRPICVISFNISYCTTNGEYVPLEIAIAKYTIQRGIMERYHRFIKPGPIAFGYSNTALEHSKTMHQIPYMGHENSLNDYMQLFREIYNFLMKDDELLPLFCLEESMEQTVGCLQWICNRAGQVWDVFVVWNLAYLLSELCEGAENPLSSVLANDALTKPTFDYSIDTRCDFHEDLDSPHCALGCVNRQCFLMSDHVCNIFNVEITTNHLPTRSLAKKDYSIYYPQSQAFHEPFQPNFISKKVEIPTTVVKSTKSVDSDTASIASSLRQPKLSIAKAIAEMVVNSTPVAPGHGIGRGRIVKK